MSLRAVLALTGLFSFLPTPLLAGDWPMWRHDAGRSGTAPVALPDRLHRQWVRTLPAPRSAWPNESRLQFDAAYHPVVLDKTLFVGSPNDGSVRAFDTRSGRRLWTFFTEGPVRVAPVAWRNRVYVGSDDGRLYCLNAKTGRLLWTVRGAPADRPNDHHLGNARLISFWPVRGGPVIHEGVVYFGAGIWPSMGVFVTAVDAESGKMKWSNRAANYLENVRIDHNDLHEAGISPQGHLLLSEGRLLVPNGRSMPAGFDPRTGKLLYYVQGYRNGDARVTSAGKFLLVGESGVVNVADGREIGNRWVAAGRNAPRRWDYGKLDLFEGPYFGYKFMRGCNYRSAFDRGRSYGVSGGTVYAYDLNRSKVSIYEKKRSGKTVHPARWDAPLLWKLNTGLPRKQTSQVTIKAGDRLYSHVGNTLFAVAIPKNTTARPRVVWKSTVDGIVAELLAADNRLFVVLADGRIACFGAEMLPSPKTYPLLRKPLTEESGQQATRAERILKQTGVQEGYAIVRGLETGRLVEELLLKSRLHLIAVDPDRDKVNRLRERLIDAGLYGTRAEVFVGDPGQFSFPPYLASLMVFAHSPTAEPPAGVSAQALFRILRPYGGVAWFEVPDGGQAKFRHWLTATKLPGAVIRAQGDLLLLRRAGPLPGSSDWTHETGDAARTYFSQDNLVRAPLAILWYGDGPGYGFHKFKDYGRGVKPQSSGGRLFAFDDRAHRLTAIDAYTGRLLWTRDIGTSLVRYVSRTDGIYVAHDDRCDVLDPATGRRQRSFLCRIPSVPRKRPGAVNIRVTDDLLLIGIGYGLPTGHSHPAIESGLWDVKVLVALDRKTGRQFWTKEAKERFNMHAVAVGGGMVFCTDSMAPLKADRLRRRGVTVKTFPSTTTAIDAHTGQPLWTKTYEHGYRAMTGRGPLAIRPYDDWLAYSSDHQLLLLGKLSRMTAVDARSGKTVWETNGGMQPLILAGETFINQAGQRFRTTTGKRVSRSALFRRGGCNYTVGNKNLLFLRNKCATYVDLNSRREYSLRNIRSGCSNSLVAADGLLSVPCFSTGCVCNYPLQTSFAMFHMPRSAAWSGTTPLHMRHNLPK